MAKRSEPSGWNTLPPGPVEPGERLPHVRRCSDFAAGLLDRFPAWSDGAERRSPPAMDGLMAAIREHGLEAGLRRFRNREMLGIVWRDLCGLATLAETFRDLTCLAELCLQAALDAHGSRLEEQHGTPRGPDGEPMRLFVVGLGKFGGGELNLSSDIDVMFCCAGTGECDGRRGLSSDQFFTRQARAVIASLSEVSDEGFCFRVDTRLRPFGNAGPLVSSLAALEQYYQREGRDWERYALIKARPVAGDLATGERFIEEIRPFVYRRYIDYSSVESLQEMHASVQADARRKDRLDDIKRGPGGIREIEFLAQSFQILRGGREPSLQTPSLDGALREIGRLGLLPPESIAGIREDYTWLRFLENRIQALRDQQTHRVPSGEDRARIALAMLTGGVDALDEQLRRTRTRVGARFQTIFPAQAASTREDGSAERWRRLRRNRQAIDAEPGDSGPLGVFISRLERVALSQRADQRLDRFMPELLRRLDGAGLDEATLNRVFDLVLAVCRRSAYLVLLVQHPKALDRMLDLFARSEWVAEKVIRFPALLDELIDPSLGAQLPSAEQMEQSVGRILGASQGVESVLEALNYLKLATELRVAVGQLQGSLGAGDAQRTLSELACALLRGVLATAEREIARRHGRFPAGRQGDDAGSGPAGIAVIAYGTLGAGELAYGSDLDIVFLFEVATADSDGARPLPPEQYFARLAQRVISFLTVLTPSGRLYEVDTRLRPNGRAGSLVSSIAAFREYQMEQAWTWELQALTRARFVAGDPALADHFNRIRADVLCRDRDEPALVAELADMRRRMAEEQAARSGGPPRSGKHRSGGLVDIEFVAQLGVLSQARRFPRVIRETGTSGQIAELAAIGWLEPEQATTLLETLHALREQKLMSALVSDSSPDDVNTEAAAELFALRLGKAGKSTTADHDRGRS